MTTPEMLDALLERLPQLRAHGVTHVSVDPASGAVSMLIAPKPLERAVDDGEKKPPARPWDPEALGLRADTPAPLSFADRRAAKAPETK